MSQKILPGSGVIVTDNIHPQNIGPIQVVTCNGNRDVIFWGEHISIYDSPSCQVRVTNSNNVPVTLSLTGTMTGTVVPMANRPSPDAITQIAWDKEGTRLNAGASTIATLRLVFTRPAGITQDFPFVTKIMIKGTP